MLNNVCLGLLLLATIPCCCDAASVVIVNHGTNIVEVSSPEIHSITPGDSVTIQVGNEITSFGPNAVVELASPKHSAQLADGTQRYAVLFVDQEGKVTLHDTNDMQVALSDAAHRCVDPVDAARESKLPSACIAEHAFGGLPESLARAAFVHLWNTLEYWKLCNLQACPSGLLLLTSRV